MRYTNTKDGIAKWVEEYLSPTLANMPGGSMAKAEYIDLSESKEGQYIEITYDNGYKRRACVTCDSARACIFDLINQGVLK